MAAKRNPPVNRPEIHTLLTRLQILLDREDGTPPLFEVAIDAIRDFQATAGVAREESRYVGALLPERISSQLERRLQIITIDELEKVRIDRLSTLSGFGQKMLATIAAALRAKFPSRQDGSQWYWKPSYDADGFGI